MNRALFISVFPKCVINDILVFRNGEMYPCRRDISLIKNNFMYVCHHSNKICLPYMKNSLSSNYFSLYFMTIVNQSKLPSEIKHHILTQILCYINLILCSIYYIVDIKQQCHHLLVMDKEDLIGKTTTDLSTAINYYSLIIKDFITYIKDDMEKSIYIEQTSDMQLLKRSRIVYNNILSIVNQQYLILRSKDRQHIQSSLESLGCIPSYWPTSFKFRTHLFSNFKTAPRLFNKVHNYFGRLPHLYPIQNINKISRLSTDEVVHYYNFIPKVTESYLKQFTCLNEFVSLLYIRTDTQRRKRSSTIEYLPSSTNDILLQYITLHLPQWENIWLMMKWTINIQLYRNLLIYRSGQRTFDESLFLKLLFYPILE